MQKMDYIFMYVILKVQSIDAYAVKAGGIFGANGVDCIVQLDGRLVTILKSAGLDTLSREGPQLLFRKS